MTDAREMIRRAAKTIIPGFILEARRRRLLAKSIANVDRDFVGKSASEIFSEIYRRQLWGRPTSDRKFSSGHGSSMGVHVEPYVVAVGAFVSGLTWKPSVADLGCGDFNVGSKLRRYFGTYVACDVAPQVLEENRRRYPNIDVEFRQLDMIGDDLPDADVCIIRQVFQHLSNVDILTIIQKLGKYKILIVTEPVPNSEFTPNLDQPTGVSSRLARGIPSGVVLTEPPFSLRVRSSQLLCTTFDDFSHARLVTTAFWLQ